MARNPERVLDELLVAKAISGQRDAFTTLHQRWHPKLLRHAYRLLGDQEQARDAVQEAWVEIFRGIHGLRDVAAFQAWAFRIVTRRCAKLIRKLQKNRATHQALSAEQLSEETTASPQDARDVLKEIKLAIGALPLSQRLCVELFYLEDLSVAEIGTALNIPHGTVKTRLMHARKTLRIKLEGENYD